MHVQVWKTRIVFRNAGVFARSFGRYSIGSIGINHCFDEAADKITHGARKNRHYSVRFPMSADLDISAEDELLKNKACRMRL